MNIRVIKVLLGKQKKLVVAPNFCEIEASEKPCLVVWVLLDENTDAHFVIADDHDGEGFIWDDVGNYNQFKNLRISKDGKFISVEVHASKRTAAGNRRYTLRALKNKTIYTTDAKKIKPKIKRNALIFRGDHPVIINR